MTTDVTINDAKQLRWYLSYKYKGTLSEISIKKLHSEFGMSEDKLPQNKRCDYYIPDIQTVIEFDGEQHFEPVSYYGGLDAFIKTIRNDKLKMNYCFSNGIRVIRLTKGTNVDLLYEALTLTSFELITIRNNQIHFNNLDEYKRLPKEQLTYTELEMENIILKARVKHLENLLVKMDSGDEFRSKPDTDTKQLLSDNDQVEGYVAFLEEQGLLNLPYLNISTEYKRFVSWLSNVNPSASAPKIITFSKEFIHKLVIKGFILIDKQRRAKSFKSIDYNNDVNNALTEYPVNEKVKSTARFLENKKNLIDAKSIDVENVELSTDNAKDIMLSCYLAYEENELSIIDKFGDEFEEFLNN